MRDAHNREELIRVHTDGTIGPYLIVEPSQASEVEDVLRNAGIAYSVKEDAIRMGAGSAAAVFDFGIGADVQRIQRALDEAE